MGRVMKSKLVLPLLALGAPLAHGCAANDEGNSGSETMASVSSGVYYLGNCPERGVTCKYTLNFNPERHTGTITAVKPSPHCLGTLTDPTVPASEGHKLPRAINGAEGILILLDVGKLVSCFLNREEKVTYNFSYTRESHEHCRRNNVKGKGFHMDLGFVSAGGCLFSTRNRIEFRGRFGDVIVPPSQSPPRVTGKPFHLILVK